MKRVLVTGGTGLIAQHSLDPLIKHGLEVHVISSQPVVGMRDDINFYSANLLDCHRHLNLMKRIQPHYLLHAAWYTENGQFWDAVANVYWLKASISLADAFFAVGGERLLGVGTCAEYDWREDECIEGKTSENPLNLYGKMKKSTYECLLALAKSKGRMVAWGRVFFPYGPRENKSRLIPYIITQLLQEKHAKCTHGNQIRDFLHVSDIGAALAAVLLSDVEGIINIASGIPIKIKDVAIKIAKQLHKEELIQLGAIAEPLYSPACILANVNRLKNEVGWQPALSLDIGLQNTISWWQQTLLKEKII